MDRKLKVAMGCTCSKPGNLTENLKQIEELASQAALNKCKILVTPEMSAVGYGGYKEVIKLSEEAGKGPVYEGLFKIARKYNLVITAGYVEKNLIKNHIAHYAVFPDGSFVSQRKHRSTPSEKPLDPGIELYYDDTEEIGHVPEGKEHFEYFEVDDVKCVIVICADCGIKNLRQILHKNKVDMMIVPVGAGGKKHQRLTIEDLKTEEGINKYRNMVKSSSLPQEGAIECILYKNATVAVNMNGFDGIERYHSGSGSIVAPSGQILAYIPDSPIIEYQKPGFAFAEINFNEII